MNIYLGEFHRKHLCGLRQCSIHTPHAQVGLQLPPALEARPAGAILRQRSPAGRAPARRKAGSMAVTHPHAAHPQGTPASAQEL